jgi:hypothetical protein
MAGFVSDLLLVQVDGGEQLSEPIDQDEGEDAAIGWRRTVCSAERGREAMPQSVLCGESCGLERAEGWPLVGVA